MKKFSSTVPTQVQLLKREYFNHWYQLKPYYFSMIVAKLPIQFLTAVIYLTMVYIFTDQPLELNRVLLFYFVSLLTSLTSESFGLLVSSRMSIIVSTLRKRRRILIDCFLFSQNGMFCGPVAVCPIMLLSVCGMGSGWETIPAPTRFFMKLSYLRYSLEGILESIYGFERDDMDCPGSELFCPYKKPKFLLRIMGFDNLDFRVSISALFGFYLFFNILAVYLLKNRLSYKRKSLWPIQYVSRVVKQYLNFTPYKN